MSEERARMDEVYRARDAAGLTGRYLPLTPGALYINQTKEHALARALRRRGTTSLAGLRVLDVGCGSGGELRRLLALHGDAHRLVGIDLLEHRLPRDGLFPVAIADGSAIPFGDGTFDIVVQSTMMSSVLSEPDRPRIAAEMSRVVKPGGCILWYDLAKRNPMNKDVAPITRAELVRLFPGARIEAERVTLAPPLARVAARIGFPLARLLDAAVVTRTHLFAVVEKDAT